MLGVNVMLILQLDPWATELPQVLVCENSPGLIPWIDMPLMVSVPGPKFVMTVDCAALVVPTACC